MTVVHMTSRALACMYSVRYSNKTTFRKVTLLLPAKLPGATGGKMPKRDNSGGRVLGTENPWVSVVAHPELASGHSLLLRVLNSVTQCFIQNTALYACLRIFREL